MQDANLRRWPAMLEVGRPLVARALGEEKAAAFGPRVEARLAEIAPAAPHFQQRVNTALFSMGVPSLAMYRVLCEDFGMEKPKALGLVESILQGTSRRGLEGSRLRRAVLNGVFRLRVVRDAYFKKVVAADEPEGFRFEKVDDGGALVALDVRACALVKYMKAQGAPELVPLMCRLDDLMTRYLDGIELRREGTIAMGAERCDFRYVDTKAQK